jgi:DNA polymerase type B, organellar and viral
MFEKKLPSLNLGRKTKAILRTFKSKNRMTIQQYYDAVDEYNKIVENVEKQVKKPKPTEINKNDKIVSKEGQHRITHKTPVDIYTLDGFTAVKGSFTNEKTHIKINEWEDVYNNRIMKMFKFLEKKYKGQGIVQVDILGYWVVEGIEQPETKICIPSNQLNQNGYNKFKEIYDEKGKGESASYFVMTGLLFKFVKPLSGGCYNQKGRGKDLKIDCLLLHNPYSTNNNCLFRCIEDFLEEKPNKNYCNEIRKQFNIEENSIIDLENAYKICKLLTKKTISFITNDTKLLYGDEDGEIKIMLFNNHYLRVKGNYNYCKNCKVLVRETHNCSLKTVKFINKNFSNTIQVKYDEEGNKIQRKNKGNLNKQILHYDIETQYSNIDKEHRPYIVGFCYYENSKAIYNKNWNKILDKWDFKFVGYEKSELVYNYFAGDDCMTQFYDFIETLKDIKYINAFNGSNFDHYYLFREKINSEKKVGEYILFNGSLLSATIHNKKLIDLSRHTSGNLKTNLKDNNCSIAKGDLDHNLSKRWEETDEERKTKVLEYLKCDVLGLKELYEKLNEPMYQKYNVNLCESLTTSSNAFSLWTDKFLKDEEIIEIPDVNKEICFRKSIYGGRCYKNKNRFTSSQLTDIFTKKIKYNQVYDYIFDADVVSLYPTAMANYPYPIGISKYTTNEVKNKLGIYKIKYISNKKLLTPVLPRREHKKLIWDLQDGEGWYSSIDIENARTRGYSIEIIEGYYWDKSSYVFQDYINEFYKMKKNSKKGTAEYSTSKLYLNGLYGKMIQRPIKTKDSIVSSSEEFWSIINKNIIQEIHPIGKRWLVKYISKEELENPTGAEKPTQMGSFILGYSRKIMLEHYDKCGNVMNKLPYYFDTDSLNIHSSNLDRKTLNVDDETFNKISNEYGKGLITIDKELGGIDDDVNAKVIQAIYIAPKTYAFMCINNKEQIKYHFRGKSVVNNELTWSAFRKMDKGLTYTDKKQFQIKKLNYKLNSKQLNHNYFSHKHIILKQEEQKVINNEIWNGRKFIDDNHSIPYGYEF